MAACIAGKFVCARVWAMPFMLSSPKVEVRGDGGKPIVEAEAAKDR